MSRSTLRRIRRLRDAAKPVIAELDRRKKEFADSIPTLAEEHLLRVIIVFRYGEPRIEEPLALAYGRALSKLDRDEALSIEHFRRILEKELPAGDIKVKISTWVGQMPDWLRHLCHVGGSMRILGLEPPPLSQDVRNLRHSKSDRHAWPFLPQEILEPCRVDGEQFHFTDTMSLQELMAFGEIYNKPEDKWTRQEHRFISEMLDRQPSMQVTDKND
jgi:hypothetical protein